MNLSSLRAPEGARKARKRVGRGMGSGHGKTATRGNKGQLSRSGTSRKRGFEGGQMPLQRRLPKRGFRNIFKKEYAIVNVGQLAKLGETKITPDGLMARGVVRDLKAGLKVLGSGELKKGLSVAAHAFSKSAREKILQAGGEVEVLEGA